ESTGRPDFAGAAADDEAAVAGGLDALVEFLADDGVEREVDLAGARAVLVASRKLDHPAHREGGRLLAPLRSEVDLRANPEITQLIAAPGVGHQRVLGDDAAGQRNRRKEQRPDVAIDAADEDPRSEELG